ncbi:hypothetical protein CP532_6717 [Ophiocordyceps camponoti-leonardi (nom. inval.)]|nr:hypothetical protein CP532_6717 [Ophiocordyceps camponoti-leonardi (nom. inval.)]
MDPPIRKLDLNNCGPALVIDRLGLIPGLRSSAAFFTFLRANLVLTPSALSPTTTDDTTTNNINNFDNPFFPSLPSPAQDTTISEDIPISLDVLSSDADQADALDLVALSVSQTDRLAARTLALHPLSLVLLATTWSLVLRLARSAPVLVSAVVAAGYLSAIRLCTYRYRPLRRQIDRSWLHPDSNDVVVVVVGARRADSLVGVLVLRLESNRFHLSPTSSSSSPRRRSRGMSLRGGKGVIRAWTTSIDHRGLGIGKLLLAAAVTITKDRCGRDARLGFAKDHANSLIPLPDRFATPFRKSEAQAARALEAAAEEWQSSKRKKRGKF